MFYHVLMDHAGLFILGTAWRPLYLHGPMKLCSEVEVVELGQEVGRDRRDRRDCAGQTRFFLIRPRCSTRKVSLSNQYRYSQMYNSGWNSHGGLLCLFIYSSKWNIVLYRFIPFDLRVSGCKWHWLKGHNWRARLHWFKNCQGLRSMTLVLNPSAVPLHTTCHRSSYFANIVVCESVPLQPKRSKQVCLGLVFDRGCRFDVLSHVRIFQAEHIQHWRRY